MKLPKQIYVFYDEKIVGQFGIAEITRHHNEVDMARKLQLAYNSHDELVAALERVVSTNHPYAFNMCYWCSHAEDKPHKNDCAYTNARAALKLAKDTKI